MSESSESRARVLVDRARVALRVAERHTQGRVDELVAETGRVFCEPAVAEELGELAVSETGLGRADHLAELLGRRVLGTLEDMHLQRSVGVIRRSEDRGIVEVARPMGVITFATPATAPCSSVAANALAALKTRNAAIFSPNPLASESVRTTVEVIRTTLSRLGAPPDLVQVCPGGGRTSVEQLMAKADFVVAAGGAGTVRRAYSSGTPAISSGVGNPVIIVDETANVPEAARLVVLGGSYNNGTSCSSESNVVVHIDAVDRFKAALAASGAYLCSDSESRAIVEVLWDERSSLRRDAIGREASKISAAAGFECGDSSLLVLPFGAVGNAKPPEMGEKLAPIVSLYTFEDFDEAVEAVQNILEYQGLGHSCGIHTRIAERAVELSERVQSSRVLVNQSTALGNSGAFNNGLAFTATVASGTWGGCSLSANVTWRDFLNTATISNVAPRRVPTVEALLPSPDYLYTYPEELGR